MSLAERVAAARVKQAAKAQAEAEHAAVAVKDLGETLSRPGSSDADSSQDQSQGELSPDGGSHPTGSVDGSQPLSSAGFPFMMEDPQSQGGGDGGNGGDGGDGGEGGDGGSGVKPRGGRRGRRVTTLATTHHSDGTCKRPADAAASANTRKFVQRDRYGNILPPSASELRRLREEEEKKSRPQAPTVPTRVVTYKPREAQPRHVLEGSHKRAGEGSPAAKGGSKEGASTPNSSRTGGKGAAAKPLHSPKGGQPTT
jgi:hypothetical protein